MLPRSRRVCAGCASDSEKGEGIAIREGPQGETASR
jgi:hypothetical protein